MSVFYASNECETALIETSQLIKDSKRYEGIERFTVGKWRAIEEIDLIAIVSSTEAQRVNETIAGLYTKSLKSELSNKELDKIREFELNMATSEIYPLSRIDIRAWNNVGIK